MNVDSLGAAPIFVFNFSNQHLLVFDWKDFSILNRLIKVVSYISYSVIHALNELRVNFFNEWLDDVVIEGKLLKDAATLQFLAWKEEQKLLVDSNLFLSFFDKREPD
tara:strand:- start:1237 stop:1557 length:321 start_codon:yes stop_codon:yes gene_type:complete